MDNWRGAPSRSQAGITIHQQAAILRLARQAIVVWEADGTIAEWNTGAELLFGYGAAEAVGHSIHTLLQTVHPVSLDAVLLALEHGGEWTGELQHTTKDGRTIVIESYQQRLELDGRQLILEINRDITARKQAEARLHALQALTSALSSAATPADVYQAVLTNGLGAAGSGGLEARSSTLYILVGDRLELVGGAGFDPELTTHYHTIPLDAAIPAAEAVRGAAPVWIRSKAGFLQQYPLLTGQIQQLDSEAVASLPLIVEGRVLGGINMAFERPLAFDAGQQGFLLALASQAAQALERARLYEAEREARRSQEESAALLEAVLDKLPIGLAVFDHDLRFARVNRHVAAINRMPVEAHLGHRFIDFAPDKAAAARLQALISQVFVTGEGIYNREVSGPAFDNPADIRHSLASWFPITIDNQVRLVGASVLDITERKQTEEALRESEARFRTLADSAPVLIWVNSREGCEFVNQAYLAFLGVAPADVRRFDWLQFIHPDDRDQYLNSYLDAFAQQTPFAAQFRFRRADGEYRWMASAGLPRWSDAGVFQGYAGSTVDITEIKQAQDSVRESEARLAAFMAHSPGSMFIKDATGRYLVVNHAFLATTGRSAEEVIGKTDHDLFAPELADAFVAEDRLVRESGQGQRFEEIFGYNGWQYTFLSHKFPLPGGSVGCVAADITEQKQSEQRLRQLNAASLAINAAATREEVLRRITAEARALIGAHQALTSTNAHQNGFQAITAISLSDKYAAWEQYTAKPDGSGIYALVCRNNTPMRLTQAELEAHPIWHGFGGEAANHPPMRGWLAAPLVARDGHNIGLIQLSDKYEGEFSAADEALLQQLAQLAAVALENQTLYEQEQVARAQAEEASRLKDEFLATVSHELRTPLTAFLGYAQLLQMRKRDEAYVARTVDKLVQSAKAQAQLIDDLLDVSRIVSGKLRIEPKPLDLIAVVHAALDTVRPALEAKGQLLETNLDPSASLVFGDQDRLQQVLWNLLSNATKFTPPGGRILVRLALDGRDVLLSVSDSGQGIAPDFLPFVFDRFRQADSTSRRAQNGLGLGLAIVRHLIELHGGTVQVHSAGESQGAMFTVRLPMLVSDLSDAPADTLANADQVQEEYPPVLRGLRVLVVEDQPDLLELLHDVFAACGSVVAACATAREALELARGWQPQVVVSDIAMPGEDGYWLINNIRALPPEQGGRVPAVALTAYVRMEERVRVLASGFQQYVPKPMEPAVLRGVVARLVQDAAR